MSSRLEELTEWVRNKPEEAAQRIIELERGSQQVGDSPIEALPALPDWNSGVSHPRCSHCRQFHPPSMGCSYGPWHDLPTDWR